MVEFRLKPQEVWITYKKLKGPQIFSLWVLSKIKYTTKNSTAPKKS